MAVVACAQLERPLVTPSYLSAVRWESLCASQPSTQPLAVTRFPLAVTCQKQERVKTNAGGWGCGVGVSRRSEAEGLDRCARLGNPQREAASCVGGEKRTVSSVLYSLVPLKPDVYSFYELISIY